MRRLLFLALLIGGAVLVWHYRGPLEVVWSELRGTGPGSRTPSAELAESAQAKLGTLSYGSGRVALTQAEVQSLVQYRIAGLLPAYVVAPEIELKDGRIRVRAQVPTEEFPRVAELGEVVGYLPDTTEVSATGQLIPLDGGRVGLAVDELTAAKIPIPRGVIPTVLRRLGRRNEPGLPPDALALPLPAGASTAYLRGDSLVVVGVRGPRS